MGVIGVIEADLQLSGLGTPSRLGDELCGELVLRRTIQRAARAQNLQSLHLVAHVSQYARVAELVSGLPVIVESHDQPPPLWRDMVMASRRWAPQGWRGGPGGTCALDEGFHPAVVGALARRECAQGAASIPAAAVVLDPQLLDRMVAHFARGGERLRLVFSQTPPGLAATIWDTDVLVELGTANHPPGRLLSYQPDDPSHDLTVSDCGYKVPAEVTHTAGRFLADNRRSLEMLSELLTWAGDHTYKLSVESVCRWQRERRWGEAEPVPRELELELTTADQLAESPLRPRGRLVGERGPMKVETVEGLVAGLSAYDDCLIVLGGFGEPLLHPEFARILGIFKRGAGRPGADGGSLLGLAVRTNAIGLNREVVAQMIEAGVDLVSLTLDARCPETYRAVHGADLFEQAMAGVRTLIEARQRGRRGLPIIVPELVKVAETMPDLEAFFDDWIRRVGWANLEPFNSGAGRRQSRAVMRMAPPSRWACQRLWSRCLVLADGTVVRCDQDYTGAEPVGALSEAPLPESWRGAAMGRLRSAHREGAWHLAGLCAHCQEWHRP